MEVTLKTDHPYTHMHALFASELKRTHERSTITIEDHGNAVFHITAKDTGALRAAMNSITSILSVYEKTKEATNDN